jgi:predicted metalloendopeptidase
MIFLKGALGEALGQLYVSKYFAAEAKETALRVVESVI